MKRATRMIIVLAVALTAAAMASYAVYKAIQTAPARTVQVPTVQVAVAARALPVGTLLTKDDVKMATWPAANPIPGAFAAPDAVVGRGVVAPLEQNDPITESKLAPREAGAGLPPTIAVGMRALSLSVNEVVGVAGFVVPGTHVDVLVTVNQQSDTMTRAVVSNLLVMAAGTRYDQGQTRDGKPIPTSVVTLAVTPEDAERIALAAAAGRIVLALRNPLDNEPTKTPGVRLAALMGPPAPPPVEKTVKGRKMVVAVAPPPPQPQARSIYTVETIKAAKRTEEVVK
jgi:pilus assembly protein CpaB